MLYYEVADLVTVTKTNMIDEMLCAYGTLCVASGPIYILLTYSMNPFRRMVTVGHNPTVIVYNRIPKERYETLKPRSEGDMQRDASYWRWARSSLPPGCLWRLWRSTSTLTEPFRPDWNVFCWWELWPNVDGGLTAVSLCCITIKASKCCISECSQWVSPGAPLIMLDYHSWPDWPYVYK